MNQPPGEAVPKVDPRTRPAEPEDPLELTAQVVAGDPDVMLECILQEFLWMGYRADQLWALFQDPRYPLLCALRERYGEVELGRRLAALLAASGAWQFRETIAEPEEEPQHALELLSISPSPTLAPQGASHGARL
jgi:hypothetical protein